MIRLVDGAARADIALYGAELRGWTVNDVPLLWTPDPSIWPDVAPLLFPVVGWTKQGQVRIDERSYPLGLHGFARHHTFRVLEQWPTHARLLLEADEATRALFPFDFALEVHYTLVDPALDIRLVVRNKGAFPLPYACGLHPGFRWPFVGGALGEYEILFEEREGSSVPIISADGLFTRQTRRIPLDGRHLRLDPDLFAREALCFLAARSRRLKFAHASGAAIALELDDFPHIALWARPPAPFLSIEAWTGHGDYVDASGDLFTKASMRVLAPGATAGHGLRLTFLEAHAPVLGHA